MKKLLFITLFLVGCASAPKAPITNPHGEDCQYPSVHCNSEGCQLRDEKLSVVRDICVPWSVIKANNLIGYM